MVLVKKITTALLKSAERCICDRKCHHRLQLFQTFFLRSLRQGTKNIICTVVDLNDNYPQFENLPYQVNISEVNVKYIVMRSYKTNHLITVLTRKTFQSVRIFVVSFR